MDYVTSTQCSLVLVNRIDTAGIDNKLHLS